MRRLLRSAVMVVLLAGAGALPAAAGDGTGARKSLEIGIKAYREGAVEASIEALSGALEEGLGSHDTAQALYYRGLAYRALGKPGQAIADLTGAIAEKNGLAPSQLADAADNRTAAYAEAGISSSESVVVGKPAKRLRTSARGPKPQSFLTTTSIDPSVLQGMALGVRSNSVLSLAGLSIPAFGLAIQALASSIELISLARVASSTGPMTWSTMRPVWFTTNVSGTPRSP